MPKAYSPDLRQRVIVLVEAGQSRRAVARLLSLDKSTVIRWVDQFRTSGKQAPAPRGGRRRFALGGERDWLLARIAAAPDLTGRALRAELVERGTVVSYDAVWRFLRDERLTFKKKSASRRAGPTGRGPQARAVETLPDPG